MRTLCFSALLLLTGCPKSAPAPAPATPAPATQPAEDEARDVHKGPDMVGAAGEDAVVYGTLERAKGPSGDEGTAIILTDATPVFVFEGPPPSNWEWMLNSPVRVPGKLWEKGKPGGWEVATLAEPGTPMPGDVSMPGMGF